VEAGHEVTLYTRGKKAITYKIADDTGAAYTAFPPLPAMPGCNPCALNKPLEQHKNCNRVSFT
jgi:hypothetical protein